MDVVALFPKKDACIRMHACGFFLAEPTTRQLHLLWRTRYLFASWKSVRTNSRHSMRISALPSHCQAAATALFRCSSDAHLICPCPYPSALLPSLVARCHSRLHIQSPSPMFKQTTARHNNNHRLVSPPASARPGADSGETDCGEGMTLAASMVGGFKLVCGEIHFLPRLCWG